MSSSRFSRAPGLRAGGSESTWQPGPPNGARSVAGAAEVHRAHRDRARGAARQHPADESAQHRRPGGVAPPAGVDPERAHQRQPQQHRHPQPRLLLDKQLSDPQADRLLVTVAVPARPRAGAPAGHGWRQSAFQPRQLDPQLVGVATVVGPRRLDHGVVLALGGGASGVRPRAVAGGRIGDELLEDALEPLLRVGGGGSQRRRGARGVLQDGRGLLDEPVLRAGARRLRSGARR